MTTVHPICAQRLRRLRVALICSVINLVVLLLTYHLGLHAPAKVIVTVASVISWYAILRFAYLLHFRCPGRQSAEVPR